MVSNVTPRVHRFGATSDDAKDVYHERSRRDFFGNALHAEVFTGAQLYKSIQELLLGDLNSRRTIAEFEKFLSKNFFEGKPLSLIPKLNSDVLDVKIGDEKEFPIYLLGDGIQSIILLTFPLFKYRGDRLLAFFEEPELYMHPGLQRVFMNVLASEFPNHQYFLTTHSNHFLDITLDVNSVSIFTFAKGISDGDGIEKEARFSVHNVSNEDHKSLELLGVRNSSVFLSNCTIWVEGITDRRYLLRYLELYISKANHRRFKEDLHFSFVEYGGGNVTHWSFLDVIEDAIDVEKLCGRLFLISDQDNAQGAKKERHEKLRKTLKDRYYCLEVTEIENLLTPDTIKKVVTDYEPEPVSFSEFKQEDYRHKKLGEFIETKVLNGNKRRKGSYKEESGTITNKIDFCSKALGHITSFDDLSEEAQTLTRKIYDFIARHNNDSK